MGYSPWGRKESDTTERLLNLCIMWLRVRDISRKPRKKESAKSCPTLATL